jgi:membrane protease YdiL (CAAX protease family)
MWLLIALLAAVLSLLSPAVQAFARTHLQRRPALIWLLPLALAGIFNAAAAQAHAWSWPLGFAALFYLAAPVIWLSAQGAGPAKRPSALDFAGILLLWLPLEFNAGAPLVPLAARGYLHSIAYAVAILQGLVLFLAYRPFPDLKYRLPRTVRDGWLPLAGYLVLAPVLIVLGIAIGFLPTPHLPTQSLAAMARAAAIIFIGTALPEEILFRSLIQNFLMLRFGPSLRVLLLASLIFGSAHLNNGPQPLPNWRYMIMATIAGVAYGRVFQRASSVISSAALHCLVDCTKHFVF